MKHWILFGLAYTAVYAFFAIMLVGGGHGTFTFLAPLFTWWLLIIPLFLSSRLTSTRNKVFFVLPILLHYGHIIFFLYGPSDEYLQRELEIWKRVPVGVLLAISWYLLGQVLIWITFFRQTRNHP